MENKIFERILYRNWSKINFLPSVAIFISFVVFVNAIKKRFIGSK